MPVDFSTEQYTAESNQSEETPVTPNLLLSPSDISEHQPSLVKETQEATWQEVTVSSGGGE